MGQCQLICLALCHPHPCSLETTRLQLSSCCYCVMSAELRFNPKQDRRKGWTTPLHPSPMNYRKRLNKFYSPDIHKHHDPSVEQILFVTSIHSILAYVLWQISHRLCTVECRMIICASLSFAPTISDSVHTMEKVKKVYEKMELKLNSLEIASGYVTFLISHTMPSTYIYL